jgi:predicted ribosomally synthesized peptide with SipW-like signal peptide
MSSEATGEAGGDVGALKVVPGGTYAAFADQETAEPRVEPISG